MSELVNKFTHLKNTTSPDCFSARARQKGILIAEPCIRSDKLWCYLFSQRLKIFYRYVVHLERVFQHLILIFCLEDNFLHLYINKIFLIIISNIANIHTYITYNLAGTEIIFIPLYQVPPPLPQHDFICLSMILLFLWSCSFAHESNPVLYN